MKQIIWFFFLFVYVTYGQNTGKKKDFNITGSLNLMYENYSYDAVNYESFRGRYPADFLRLSGNAVLHFGKYLNIPVGISFSNRKTTYIIPDLPNDGIYNYIRSPRNNFHINPNYKWAHLKLGTNTTKYSQLTTGNIPVFGAGFDINPGKFIFSAGYGVSQLAIEPVPELNIPGAYQQNIITGRIGYGKLNGSKVTLNFVKIKDDINSVKEAPIGIKPMEGANFSPLVELKLSKNWDLITETAVSVKTTDLEAEDNIISYPNSFITVNNTTVVDYSHITGLKWHNKKVSIGGEFNYIGPGYLFAGYRNTETDIIDYKLTTAFKLYKNKVNVNAVAGIRTNNIMNTKLAKNNRFIGNINVFAQITKAFSLNAGFNNYGFRNDASLEMLKIEMVNNSFSLNPVYQFKTKTNYHQFGLAYNYDQFKQYDFLNEAYVNTTTNTYNFNYSLSFLKMPLVAGFNALYMTNQSDLSAFEMNNYSVRLGYKFFEKKLNAGLLVNYLRFSRDDFTPDNRLNTKVKLKYKINKKLNSQITYSLNNNTYGSYRPGAVLNENKISLSITQKF